MDVTNQISNAVKNALRHLAELDVESQDDFKYGLFTENVEIQLEHPADSTNGDFSCNVAMIGYRFLSPNYKVDIKSPREFATKIVQLLNKDSEIRGVVDKIDVAGPGFINLYIKSSVFVKELYEVVNQKDRYGSKTQISPKKILVDYSSPNIAKRFSIGHLRSTIIGQAIYNMYGFLGWQTVGDNHIGDWGTQFGMIIAAVEEDNLDIAKLDVESMEKLYVDFNKRVESNPEMRKKATDAFVRLEQGDQKAREIWKKSVEVSMAEFDQIYDLLGVKIDYIHGESYYENYLQNIIDLCISKGIAREDKGAYIIEFDDMPPAMLVKSDGGTTYLTRDLATVLYRRQTNKLASDIYTYEVGAEQTLHFRQVFRTSTMLGWGSEEDYVHIAHGMIRLPEGKMSTRKGNTIKLEELLDRSIIKASEIIDQKIAETNGSVLSNRSDGVNVRELAKMVGIGAIKYNDLKHSPATDYVFTWEEAMNMEGNSGPYLQYTHARICSLLERLDFDLSSFCSEDSGGVNLVSNFNNQELTEYELRVLKLIPRFSETLEDSSKKYSPNLLCEYLFKLTQAYNSFYAEININKTSDQGLKNYRLLLSFSVKQVLENGLGILGIGAPNAM